MSHMKQITCGYTHTFATCLACIVILLVWMYVVVDSIPRRIRARASRWKKSP